MRPVKIMRHPLGPRVWVLGRRIHHGAVGAVLTAVGLLLAVHDRHDLGSWFASGHDRDF